MGKTQRLERAIIFGGCLEEINPQITYKINDTDYIICADAGYKFVKDNDLKPDLIVGDFDSSAYPKDADCEIIKLPNHKDDTDLLFALRAALERGFRSFILTGVTGGRLDQTLATVSTLNFLSNYTNNFYVFDLNTSIYIVSSELTLKRPEYDCYFSVFSLCEKSEGVTITGSEYQVLNGEITDTFPIGVSNEFKDDTVSISVKNGKLLVLIVKKD